MSPTNNYSPVPHLSSNDNEKRIQSFPKQPPSFLNRALRFIGKTSSPKKAAKPTPRSAPLPHPTTKRKSTASVAIFEVLVAKGEGTEYNCKLCNISCTSENGLFTHIQGRKHCKRAKIPYVSHEIQEINCSVIDGGGECRVLTVYDQPFYTCAICQLSFANNNLLGNHNGSRKHLKKLEPPPAYKTAGELRQEKEEKSRSLGNPFRTPRLIKDVPLTGNNVWLYKIGNSLHPNVGTIGVVSLTNLDDVIFNSASHKPKDCVKVPFVASKVDLLGNYIKIEKLNTSGHSTSPIALAKDQLVKLSTFSGLLLSSVTSSKNYQLFVTKTKRLGGVMIVPIVDSSAAGSIIDWSEVNRACSELDLIKSAKNYLFSAINDINNKENNPTNSEIRDKINKRILISNDDKKVKLEVMDIRVNVPSVDELFVKIVENINKATTPQPATPSSPPANPHPPPIAVKIATYLHYQPIPDSKNTSVCLYKVNQVDRNIRNLTQTDILSLPQSVNNGLLNESNINSIKLGPLLCPPKNKWFAPKATDNTTMKHSSSRMETHFDDNITPNSTTIVTPRISDCNNPYVVDITLTNAIVHPIHRDTANACLPVPLLLHYVETCRIADECKTQLLPGINHSTPSLRFALTSPTADNVIDFERYETLGDSVLKLLSSLHLLVDHPLFHEGQLTLLKTNVVNNNYLASIAKEVGLERFIISKNVVSRLLVPEGFREEAEDYDDAINDKPFHNNDSLITTVSDAMLADVTEAVIGSLFVDSNFALDSVWSEVLIKWGILEKATVDSETNEKIFEPFPDIKILQKELELEGTGEANSISIPALESLLDYQFNFPFLAIEALSHSSVDINRNYQRLEFIGDSILDVVTTKFLFLQNQLLSPGMISKLRSRIVRNYSLGRHCLSSGLYKFLRLGVNSLTISRAIEKSVREFNEEEIGGFYNCKETESIQDETDNEIEDEGLKKNQHLKSVLKVLGDILKAVIGAVYVDSGGDVTIVEKVVDKILLTPFLRELLAERVLAEEKM